MRTNSIYTSDEISDIYNRHIKMVYRVCYSYMKNAFDTENAVQDTFLKLISSKKKLESLEHEKAWLIRTASNICKNYLRHWFYKHDDIDAHSDFVYEEPKFDEVFEIVMNLPDRYKTVIYLYYYEGYNSVDIAKMLRKPTSTIRNQLMQARKLCKERLGGDFDEE